MQKKPAGFIKGMEHVSAVPIGVHAFIYEVTEDGTHLEPVKIDILNGDVTADAPDLRKLQYVHEISAAMGGARLYHIHTLVRENAKEWGAPVQPPLPRPLSDTLAHGQYTLLQTGRYRGRLLRHL